MATTALAPRRATLRRDLWWLEPALVVIGFTAFVIFSLWAGTTTAGYYADPYISPYFSPCITANCEHLTFGSPIIGDWYQLAPAGFVVFFPLAFRGTCYFFRRTYYRSYFLTPAACAVRDVPSSYTGESRFPWILQNVHRYTWYLAVAIFVVLAYDALVSFRADGRWMVGLGSLVMTTEAVLIGLYTFSCHSCRALCGGWVDRFHARPFWYRLWKGITRLNVRHGLFFWTSLGWTVVSDVYVRLLAANVIVDPRLIF